MIKALLIIKVKQLTFLANNPLRLIFSIFLVFLSVSYGIIAGIIINQVGTGKIEFLNSNDITNLILLIIMLLTILRMFIPTYEPMQKLFPNYYPLSKKKVYIASLINDYVSSFFVFILIAIISCTIILHHENIIFLYKCLLVVIVSHLFRRNLQYLIDFKFGKVIKIITSLILIASMSVLIVFPKISTLILTYLLYFLLLFIMGYVLELFAVEKNNIFITNRGIFNNVFFKLILNNRNARLSIFSGLLFKLLFLLIDSTLYIAKAKHLFNEYFLLTLFASPLIIFTYTYNNIWGFWKNIWLNMELRHGEYLQMMRWGVNLILIPLLIDAMISLPFFLFEWENKIYIIIFYTASSIYLISSSFLWSAIVPRFIKKTFQMQGTASPIISILSISILGLFTLVANISIWLLIPVVLILSVSCFKTSINIYKNKKYRIAEKLL